jgi:1,4-dihydroxy-6-naphthoate synthase
VTGDRALRLGISPCPNDTFTFHGVLERTIDLHGLRFDVELADVQELNERTAAGDFDFSKVSFNAALELGDRFGVLPAGAAMGVGVGPIVVAADSSTELRPSSRVVCPGSRTTATLLFRAFHPEVQDVTQEVFSEIAGSLHRGEADFGVLIHEGRFTLRENGLELVEDLGERWERRFGLPLPLGGIVGSLDLPRSIHDRTTAAIRDSLRYARAHREEALRTVRRHAQELDEAVIWPYIDLYVNDYSWDIGETGAAALDALATLAAETTAARPASLEVLA